MYTNDLGTIRANWLLALLAALLLGVGCKGDSDAPTATFVLQFIHEGAGAALVLNGGQNYTNAAGNPYDVTKFEYLVTDVRLRRADGTSYYVAKAIEGDVESQGDVQHTFSGVPVGSYAGIEFRWGVDPALNVTGYLDSGFDGLLWPPPMGGGYHNMRFEGAWTETTPGDRNFLLHSGNLNRCHPPTISVSLCPPADLVQFDGSFVVSLHGSALTLEEGETWLAQVSIDVDAWMNDPVIDLAQPWTDQSTCTVPAGTCLLSFPTMPGAEPQKLMHDNADDVFRVISIDVVP